MSFTTRFMIPEDAPHLVRWLSDPDTLRWFPMINIREIEDSIRMWVHYTTIKSSLTVESEGQAVGTALLYIQPFQKLAHQCLFAILVSPQYRGKGAGTFLLSELIKLAKEQFHIEILHLEVYEGNPAISLYKRMGFQQYGIHPKFLKEEGKYATKILMQRKL